MRRTTGLHDILTVYCCKLTHLDMLGHCTWRSERSLQDKDVHDLMGLDCCTAVLGSALLLHMKQSIGSMFATDPSFHQLEERKNEENNISIKIF